MRVQILFLLVVSGLFLTTDDAIASPTGPATESGQDSLVGAWRSRVQFSSGAFAAVGNLEFMYLFNPGGTLLESSNYDAAPPVPPAFGVWRKISPNHYEARYVFFLSKAPKAFEDLAASGGWLPGGSGVLVEKISLSQDGKTFSSTIRLAIFDEAGKPTENGSEAQSQAVRIGFESPAP